MARALPGGDPAATTTSRASKSSTTSSLIPYHWEREPPPGQTTRTKPRDSSTRKTATFVSAPIHPASMPERQLMGSHESTLEGRQISRALNTGRPVDCWKHATTRNLGHLDWMVKQGAFATAALQRTDRKSKVSSQPAFLTSISMSELYDVFGLIQQSQTCLRTRTFRAFSYEHPATLLAESQWDAASTTKPQNLKLPGSSSS
jgi:hypothetical protein